jgi:hypothetical protein
MHALFCCYSRVSAAHYFRAFLRGRKFKCQRSTRSATAAIRDSLKQFVTVRIALSFFNPSQACSCWLQVGQALHEEDEEEDEVLEVEQVMVQSALVQADVVVVFQAALVLADVAVVVVQSEVAEALEVAELQVAELETLPAVSVAAVQAVVLGLQGIARHGGVPSVLPSSV